MIIYIFKTNDLNIKELPGEHVFQKDVPYVMELSFRNMTLRRNVSKLLVIIFLKLINNYKSIIYIYIYI